MLSKSEYYEMIAHWANALVVDAESGIIEYISPHLERLLGYQILNSLLGQPTEVLVPERVRERYAKYREEFNINPSSRNLPGFSLTGLQADGTEFPAAVFLHFERSRSDLRFKMIAKVYDLRVFSELVSP